MFGITLKTAESDTALLPPDDGMLLVPYVYSPLGDVAASEWVVRIALIPLTIFTGIAMWQQAKWEVRAAYALNFENAPSRTFGE